MPLAICDGDSKTIHRQNFDLNRASKIYRNHIYVKAINGKSGRDSGRGISAGESDKLDGRGSGWPGEVGKVVSKTLTGVFKWDSCSVEPN
jgi:hypothetical protein